MQKLLQDNNGLEYICHTYERFAHVATVLSSMVEQLAKEQSTRLLKHVIRCYQRLCDNSRYVSHHSACHILEVFLLLTHYGTLVI